MKLFISLLFTLFSSTLSFAQESKPGKAIIKTNIFCDHCKACETCGVNLQSNILKIKGVKMYELDEKAMTITVYYNAKKTTVATIKTAISKMGYDADNVKADISAYEKLDDCCKKI